MYKSLPWPGHSCDGHGQMAYSGSPSLLPSRSSYIPLCRHLVFVPASLPSGLPASLPLPRLPSSPPASLPPRLKPEEPWGCAVYFQAEGNSPKWNNCSNRRSLVCVETPRLAFANRQADKPADQQVDGQATTVQATLGRRKAPCGRRFGASGQPGLLCLTQQRRTGPGIASPFPGRHGADVSMLLLFSAFPVIVFL
ncbi:unnamed protein product [Boreogadus saida]